jgi:hypothetical protein
MNYIIVIAIIICLLIIIFSYFSSKYVNKEGFQTGGCDSRSNDQCEESPECELILPPWGQDDSDKQCKDKGFVYPCSEYNDETKCPLDRCQLNPGQGEAPPVCGMRVIKSNCYGKDKAECESDDKCNVNPILGEVECNYKNDKTCDSLELSECIKKSGDPEERENLGCRLKIVDSDNSINSKCSSIVANDTDSSNCHDAEGCVYQKGVGCIDYNDLLFEQCSTYSGFSIGGNSVNSYVEKPNDTKGDICRSINDNICKSTIEQSERPGIFTSKYDCSNYNSHDRYSTIDVRKNKNSRIGFLLNKNCNDKEQADCNNDKNECSYIDGECIYQPFMEDKKRISVLEEKCSELSNGASGASNQTECSSRSNIICGFHIDGKCSQHTEDSMNEQQFENQIKGLCVDTFGTDIFCRARDFSGYTKTSDGDPIEPGVNYTGSQSEKDDTLIKNYKQLSDEQFVEANYMVDEGKKIPKFEDFKVTCNFDDINKKKKKTDGTLECQSPPDFCFNITNDEKNIVENQDVYKQTCFPYTPGNKANFSLGIEDSDASLLNFPNTFFKSKGSTLIALNHLKCEDINDMYQKAKDIVKITPGGGVSQYGFEQKAAAENIIAVIEDGEIVATDNSKKCKFAADGGECYNMCEGVQRFSCNTQGDLNDQNESKECIVLDGESTCKRKGCLEHNDNAGDCAAAPNCIFTASVLANKCIPDVNCSDGEELKILPTNPTTLENEFVCEKCKPGFFEDSNMCTPCPTNHYSDTEGATSCSPKRTCNLETHYISSPVDMQIPESIKDEEYILKMKSNFISDKFGTTKDRTCVELNKCEKSNDKFLVDKNASINPEKAKQLFNEYDRKHNSPRYLQQRCEYYETCPTDMCRQDGVECKELDLPLRRYSDYTCDDLTTCNNNTHISNYQEMLDKEFDTMFTNDRTCIDSTTCFPGEHEVTGRVTPSYPIVTDSSGNEMYTQDRDCTTCQVDFYSDEPNMTQCVPQPTLGLGMGTINYDPTTFESRTKILEHERCDKLNNFQDRLPPHKEPCKTKRVCEFGSLPQYKTYTSGAISCNQDNEFRDDICDVVGCRTIKDIHAAELTGLIP